MLSKEEEKFVLYWSVQRTKKRRAGYNVGFPLGVLIVAGIFLNLITGWHKQAAAALRSDYSTILVIVVAAVAIVIFFTVFAARYQWEQREQRYTELVGKQDAAGKNTNQTF